MQESPTKRKKITLEDYQIRSKLGRGAYGEVYEAKKIDTSNICALKQIQKRLLGRQQKEYQALVQRQLLTKIEHPGVIKILASFQDTNNLYFALELCEGGEFKNFLQIARGKLNHEAFRFYAAEIVNVLEYLHQNGIVHRDLKPQNIMISKQGHLKLIDFGTAQFSKSLLVSQNFKERINSQKKTKEKKYLGNQEETKDEQAKIQFQQSNLKSGRRSTFVGTSYYISPQLLEKNICEAPSDLWALGCCIYQFYYGKTPFSDCQQFAVFQKIKNLQYHFPPLPTGESIPDEAKDLISKLLIKEPYKRLGSKDYNQLKSHIFFKGINIDKIFENVPPIFLQNKQQKQLKSSQSSQNSSKLSYISDKNSENGSQKRDCQYRNSPSLMHGKVQKRSFLIYKDIFMTLCNSGSIIMSNSQNPSKRKVVDMQLGNMKPAQMIEGDKFTIATIHKKYVMKSENAEDWVRKINQRVEMRKGSS